LWVAFLDTGTVLETPLNPDPFRIHSTAKKYLLSAEDKLLNSNVSRTFYTQKLLPGAGAAKIEETLDSGRPAAGDKTAVTAPKDFVRTNAADQKMDRFLVKKTGGESAGDHEKKIPQQVEQEVQAGGSTGAANRPDCQLTSVKALRLQLQVSIFVFGTFSRL
jgi:hypothetical protein